MDLLNDYYPIYPQKPDNSSDESEAQENQEHIERLDAINARRKRKRVLSIDDYCLKYGDDIWYIWCIIQDYSQNVNLFDRVNYGQFCQICYENSTKL
jgi:hypothetical protein